MKEINIKLSMSEEIKDFVKITSRYPYDIDLQSGRYTVDAKSILGIFSLDLAKPVHMLIYSDDCDNLLQDLKPYTV